MEFLSNSAYSKLTYKLEFSFLSEQKGGYVIDSTLLFPSRLIKFILWSFLKIKLSNYFVKFYSIISLNSDNGKGF